MPNLKDGWFADRAPGGGKVIYTTAGNPATATPVGGLVGVGASGTPPAGFPALPEPGTPIPPPGATSPAPRSSFFLAFKNATGFDGKTWLSIPTTTAGTSWSFSGWLNFGVNNTPGFNPSPTNGATIVIPANGSPSLYTSGGALELDPSSNGNVSGPQFLGISNNAFGAVTYPSDGTEPTGWFHLMAAARLSGTATFPTERFLCWINDTEIFDQTATAAATPKPNLAYDFSASDGANFIGFGGISIDTTFLYAAVAEIWEAPNHFVDWAVKANRYKFHTVDDGFGTSNAVYAPVDIGSNGARPFGFVPRLYLSGGPSQFVKNRATGGTLTVNGDALVAIDDLPAF